jgi:phage terminase small subunit
MAEKNSYRLLVHDGVKEEITRLKEIKKQSIMLNEDDIIEKYMNIAFSDMTDFVEWENKDDKNIVKFRDSNIVDGGVISQIKQGKDGASIKLEDRQKALEWLSNFFEMNPLNNHKKEYDNNRLKLQKEELEYKKWLEKEKLKKDDVSVDEEDDGFIEALELTAEDVWKDDIEDSKDKKEDKK